MHRRRVMWSHPQRFYEELLFGSITWPGHTSQLSPDSIQDYKQRQSSSMWSIDELYHENSKLIPERASDLAALHFNAARIREELVEREGLLFLRSDAPRIPEPRSVGRVLEGVRERVNPGLLYAISVDVLVGDLLARWDVKTGRLKVAREFSHATRTLIAKALMILGEGPELAATDNVVFVIGRFSRNSALLGVRGYRRTLLDAGQLAGLIALCASETTAQFWLRSEFDDNTLDEILGLDGVEQSLLCVVGIGDSVDEDG